MLNALNRLFVLPETHNPTPQHQVALTALCAAMGHVGESQNAREFVSRVLSEVAPAAGWKSAYICVPRSQGWTLLEQWDPTETLLDPASIQLPKKLSKSLAKEPFRVVKLGGFGPDLWPLSDVFGQPMDEETAHGALTGLVCDGELCGALVVCADPELLAVPLLQDIARGLSACLQLAMSWGQIKRERVLLSAMFDACPDPVVLYDPNIDRLVETNQSALQHFDLQRHTLHTSPLMDSPLHTLAVALSSALMIAPDEGDVRREVACAETTWDLSCSVLQQAGRELVLGVLRAAAPEPLQWDSEEDPEEEDEDLNANRVFVLEDESGTAQRWVVVRHNNETDAKLLTHKAVPLEERNSGLHNPLRDRLTGLVSGPLILEHIEHGLRKQRAFRSGEDESLLTVFVVDLDGFHIPNRTYGWRVGNAILTEAAQRLQAALRDTDTVCRWQDDEFVILAEDQASTEGVWAVGQRIRNALSVPYEVGELEVAITASVGATTSEETARSASHMIEDARLAMRKAKRDGQGIRMFDPDWDTVQDTQEILGRKWTIQAS